ncbi:leucine-rich repeat receptor-like serine/threonine/tyrosine-protein kinase SOBIR1 [Nymphaea colorata]|nr:leucine-rich repeat receptor-like serine/threonine/tyrosine-protein kinase SOBIR1 [Nymphaea colorata]
MDNRPVGFFFVNLFVSLASVGVASGALSTQELNALGSLRNHLAGLRSLWGTSESPCHWTGITCETLPDPISQTTRVTRIVLESKRLQGVIPPEIGGLAALKVLSLRGNEISGRIPAEIGGCQQLQELNLRGNLLSGEVPPELSLLRRLSSLDLSTNRFSGEIAFLERLSGLEFLSLSRNRFVGKIPSQLRHLPRLRWVDFSGNDLEEEVPLSLSRSTGKRLRFSGNSARGMLPSIRSRKNFSPKRFLSAENLSPDSPPSAHLNGSTRSRNSSSRSSALSSSPAPSPQPHQNSEHKHNHRFWILGFAIGWLLGMVFGVIFSVIVRIIVKIIRGRNKQTGPIIYSPLIKKAEHLAFLESEEGVASLEIIGRGGCGEVYKAALPGGNGKMIAIKKVHHPATDPATLTEEDTKNLDKKMRQIKSELETVGHIRHRNLLPLLASVARPDCHYLVYEYMENGSLQNALTNAAEGKKPLGWPDRHRIALGIAAGLKYLHFYHSPRIIHRDLKPANVLLDDDLEPRIADFGLAKSMPDMYTHATTSNVAGTFGYIAPEYYQTLKFTDKCDIFSFGVVLAAMVTGKQPSDEFFQHTKEMNMVKWLRNVMSSKTPAEAIDPNLAESGFEEQMLLVLKIACFCTFDEAKSRPNSKEVYIMLAQIK